MDDLISRKAALDAMCEYLNQPIHRGSRRWTKGCEAVSLDLLFTVNGVPSVPAVPLDKMCEWMAENSMNIPCESCRYFSNQYCTAIGDMSKPCPRTKDDWREAITKWMEEDGNDK